MKARQLRLLLSLTPFFVFCLSTATADQSQQLVKETFPAAQAELRETVLSIANDIMSANIEGLQAAHRTSDKGWKIVREHGTVRLRDQ